MEGGVELPRGLGFGNGDSVDEVEHYFHCEEGDEEADAVEGGSGGVYAAWGVADLGDVIIEGKDWACEVQRGV